MVQLWGGGQSSSPQTTGNSGFFGQRRLDRVPRSTRSAGESRVTDAILNRPAGPPASSAVATNASQFGMPPPPPALPSQAQLRLNVNQAAPSQPLTPPPAPQVNPQNLPVAAPAPVTGPTPAIDPGLSTLRGGATPGLAPGAFAYNPYAPPPRVAAVVEALRGRS